MGVIRDKKGAAVFVWTCFALAVALVWIGLYEQAGGHVNWDGVYGVGAVAVTSMLLYLFRRR